jgi:flagellar hook-associated protein 1 FlgK
MSLIGLLDTSRRALGTQTTGIQVIGDNIANVNTPGYTRRRAEIVSTATGDSVATQVGTGSEVRRTIRIVDNFLNTDLLARIGDKSQAEIKSEFLARAQAPFQLDGEAGRIGYELNEFFSSLEDLAANPGDIPLRTQVIQKGADLSATINSSYTAISTLQREADDRIKILVTDVNRITESIAALNDEISNSEIGVQEALTLRDQRDELLRDLSELVSFRSIEDTEEKLTVYVENGFALVAGNKSFNLETTPQPSFAPVGGYPVGLDGQALSHIVYDFGGTTHIDLTNILVSGSGEIAGLLELRGVQAPTDTSPFSANGQLVEIASRIELISRDLLTRFNLEYLGPDETAGGTHQPSSFDLDGNQPIPFGLFSFSGANVGNNFGDADSDGRPEAADLTTIASAGVITNFSSRLRFNVTSERNIAASRDLNPVAGSTSYATGDSSNIEALLTLRNTSLTYSGVGTVSANTTIDGMYSLTVAAVGAQAARAESDLKIYEERETQTRSLQQGYSGVNLDEEFSKLISFQRAFQAASKLIGIGNELTQDLINLI